MLLVLSSSSETFYKSWNGQNSNDSNVIGVTCVDSYFGTRYHSVTFAHEGQFGQYKNQNPCFRPNYIHGINFGANRSLLWSLTQLKNPYNDILIGTGVDVCCNFCYNVSMDHGGLVGHFQYSNYLFDANNSVWDCYRSTKHLLSATT